MLRNLDSCKLQVTEAPTVKTRRDEAGNKTAVLDPRDNSTQYVVRVFARPLDEDGTPRGKGEEVAVTLESEPEYIPEGTQVELINPRVSYWQVVLDSGVIPGQVWTASGITPVRR